MKAGFAVWNDRISPVFDASRNILLVDAEEGEIQNRRRAVLPEDFARKIQTLREFGVDTLVCGAISRELAAMVADARIRLIAFVAGEVEEVIAACLGGGLPDPSLRMPGCQQCRCRNRNRCGQGGGPGGPRKKKGDKSCQEETEQGPWERGL